jgi:dihydropyrimidine dehydrogenase (NAD+) subunit PreT
MAEYKKPENEEDFVKNFKDKTPLMNDTQAYYESSRCLFCYDAPCMNACPTGIDIPLFIKQIHTGNAEGAAKTIYDSNWIGNACGTVCPTGVLCEGACVYNNQDVPPLQIGRLQNYATRTVIDSGKSLYKPGADNGKKVAVIGAGPAGIACACELRVMGYAVDLFEAKEKPSGLTVYGIAPYKITNEEVLDEVSYLQDQLGFNINYNSAIKTKEQLTDMENNYDAIFVGVGLGPTAYRNIPGEDKKEVHGAVEFVEDLRMNHHNTKVGDKVVVLGAGNTAMDVASESARMGASEVVLTYRGSKEKMGAYDFEYELALSAGVKSVFDASPAEILGNEKVEGVRFTRSDGSEFTIECDMVIKATGQSKQGGLYALIEGLELDDSSIVKVNPENNQTTNEKYFAGGDAINGGAEVVNAAYDGKLAANGIDQWLNK